MKWLAALGGAWLGYRAARAVFRALWRNGAIPFRESNEDIQRDTLTRALTDLERLGIIKLEVTDDLPDNVVEVIDLESGKSIRIDIPAWARG